MQRSAGLPTSTTPSRRISPSSASLQPFADLAEHTICEFPVKPRQLAIDLTTNHLTLDPDGRLAIPDAPGLGMEVNPEALAKYRVEVEITVNGKRLFGSRA